MAAAQPAEAQIVYTPAHIYFEAGTALDLNNDGTTDFLISQSNRSFGWDSLRVAGAPGNGVRGWGYASRLARGVKIGPGESFDRGNKDLMVRYSCFTTCYLRGPWQNGVSGFLGFEFQIDGQTHYGWAEVFITSGPQPYRGVVRGYAYNSVPNQPLLAGFLAGERDSERTIGKLPPQPVTLGLLALGAPGLDIWRSRRRQLTAD
jgi:hypothetical protein